MAYDERIAERVRRALASRANITEKKMMGALTFMLNGVMCCGVTGTALMVRVGPEAYARTLAEPHVRPMDIAGRKPRGFVCIEPRGLATESALAEWVQRGLDLASTLPAKARAPAKRQRNQ